MRQVPVITQKHYEAAWASALAPTMSAVDICNKAIEIAFAEQEELENEANESINQLVDKDMQDQFISAKEAESLGVGSAEYSFDNNVWYVCKNDCEYSPLGRKYRAIRKEVPAESHAELRALYAQQVKDGTLGNFVWEYEHSHSDGKKPVLGAPMFVLENKYFCTPKPTCQVRNDDTGELKTMTRESAQKLQAETKDVCDWLAPGNYECATFSLNFNANGIYIYKLKAKKPVSWKDVPVGVAVVDITTGIQWIYAECLTDAALLVSSDKDAFRTTVFIDLTLAPADQQPWLNWRGGDCPVPDGAVVEATCRSGYPLSGTGQKFSWKHDTNSSDIIEYRVIGIADGWELTK